VCQYEAKRTSTCFNMSIIVVINLIRSQILLNQDCVIVAFTSEVLERSWTGQVTTIL